MTISTDTTTNLTGTYAIDPTHSAITFVARHAMVTKVRGAFNEYEGSGYLDETDPSRSHLELSIKVASIDTRNADRDAHLRSNDFFAMEQFPEIHFVSTAVERLDPEHYEVTGDLTMKGVTRSVVISFEYTGSSLDPYNNRRIGLEGKATVSRSEWGINWNAALETGGILVSEKVALEFDVSAIKTSDLP